MLTKSGCESLNAGGLLKTVLKNVSEGLNADGLLGTMLKKQLKSIGRKTSCFFLHYSAAEEKMLVLFTTAAGEQNTILPLYIAPHARIF